MSELSKEGQLYLEQMQEWLEEQHRLDQQIERTIDFHLKMAASNQLQLRLHRERVDMGRKEFEQWKAEHGIEETKTKDTIYADGILIKLLSRLDGVR
jgi:hypothetical protein